MNDILFRKIKRANSKYTEYLSACDKVAKAAQKHINWNNNVGCAYIPGDGLCVEIEARVFFRSASVFAPSARSALFNIYNTGLFCTSAFNFLLKVAAGARASSTNITPSTSGTLSCIMRIAFVICPGNHWMNFIELLKMFTRFSAS